MNEFTQWRVEAFLDRTAERTPTPGGGGVTALAGALACAMGRMVLAYSVGRKTEDAKRARVEAALGKLRRADELLRASITADARAYEKMTDLSRAAREDESQKAPYTQAILAAVAVPMEMAALASGALDALDAIKADTSRYLVSDLGVAAVLADATARAARYSVLINVQELKRTGPPGGVSLERIATEIEGIVAHCDERRATIEAYVQAVMAGS